MYRTLQSSLDRLAVDPALSAWGVTPQILDEAREIAIGARVAVHWSEAECPDQEGTVIGVNIERLGKVTFTVIIDGDQSPTDGFTHDLLGIEGGTIRVLSPAPAEQTSVRSLDDWHEDYGHVVWWTWENGQWLGEPSYIGSPLCDDWPGYHTHWSEHPSFPAPL